MVSLFGIRWQLIGLAWYWLGILRSLSVRVRTRGLVRPLFGAQTPWFGILDFCNAEEEWVRHGVEDREVCDGNDV